MTAGGNAATPEGQQKLEAEIANLRYFQGDEWIDWVNWGERVYSVGDTIGVEPTSTVQDFEVWGRVARMLQRAGIMAIVHSTLEWTIEQQLRQVERMAGEYPVRNLRWAFMHIDQITPEQIERMKRLGMYLAVHPRTTISGVQYRRYYGDRAYEMPPLKTIQDSGIHWGFGTDAFEVNQYRPFTTLWWAVTGKMVGGTVVTKQTISREDALIAHTRKNAHFFFRESDIGSIQPGKLADLAVLNRDYLTVPADDIRHIESVLTMVGGRIVYNATAASASASAR